MWQAYPRQKQAHALAVLLELLGIDGKGDSPIFAHANTGTVPAGDLPPAWNACLDDAVGIQEYVRDQVYATRKKDYDDPFRRITFRNAEEMKAVLGTAEDNSFVKQVRQETEAFKQRVAAVEARG